MLEHRQGNIICLQCSAGRDIEQSFVDEFRIYSWVLKHKTSDMSGNIDLIEPRRPKLLDHKFVCVSPVNTVGDFFLARMLFVISSLRNLRLTIYKSNGKNYKHCCTK